MIHAILRRYQGGYWRLCLHRSHRLGLRCYRGFTYDGYCGKHNETCFNLHEPVRLTTTGAPTGGED